MFAFRVCPARIIFAMISTMSLVTMSDALRRARLGNALAT